MAERDRPHIVVPTPPASEPFAPVGGGGGTDRQPFVGDRSRHGRRLKRELEDALAATTDESDSDGAYISFVSFPGLELALESLDPQAAGDQPELLAVRTDETEDGPVQIATVFVPDGKKEYFFSRLDAYVKSATKDKARNAALVEGIQSIRRATIRELWTDPDELFPDDESETTWWEVWLRNRDGDERQRFTQFSMEHHLAISRHHLGFGDRTVILLRASATELSRTFTSLDDIAELRRPHDVATFLVELPAIEQAQWVDELRQRLGAPGDDAPAVCILDTGVQDSHPLLSDSLAESDVHAAEASWLKPPVSPHGTEMAGLALYGDLRAAVTQSTPIQLQHRLESVKFLPDSGQNDLELYGAITARSVDRPEIEAAERQRVFLLAVTARRPDSAGDDDMEPGERPDAGRPTSWSATIDALSFGRAIDDSAPGFTYLDRDEIRRPRLFVISAGNIRDIRATDDHLARSILEPVEDPAQSWNAITVGAYSAHDDMSGAPGDFAGYVPIAPRGELSPVSRTSVVFDRRKWPFKPDVVADGGNVAASPDKSDVDTPPNLALVTTRLQRLGVGGLFTTTRDTSAASAQVAAMAADVQGAYPDLRPETVRGLIVHSARWTDPMLRRFDPSQSKTQLGSALRQYGMGVPDAARAMRSAVDALTLVAEARIRPYEQAPDGKGRAREMNLHELPWPTTELEELGEVMVKLRVTLSYFVEPNPSSRGWTGRYVYPSHGLRFATRRAEDSVDTFRQRINRRARVEGQTLPSLDTDDRWLFGSNQQQSAGSLHTDIWTGTAADLASKGAIAVYPVAGWWKNRRAYDQSDQGVDYSLIVSIESPEVEIDLWTPVTQQVLTSTVIET